MSLLLIVLEYYITEYRKAKGAKWYTYRHLWISKIYYEVAIVNYKPWYYLKFWYIKNSVKVLNFLTHPEIH